MPLNNSKRAILLTGAGGGIGLAALKALLSSPATCVVAVDLNATQLNPLLTQFPKTLKVVIGDVSKRQVSQVAVDTAIATFGQLDVILLNAGILAPVGFVVETDIGDWKRLFDINFFALLHTQIQIALPYIRSRNGSIIMTSSGVSVNPHPAWVAYACSKSAMNCLCAGLTVEEPSITCVCLMPGIVDTGMQKEVREKFQENLPKKQYEWLNDLHKKGDLIPPEKPGAVLAELALGGVPRAIAGDLVAWNDQRVIEKNTLFKQSNGMMKSHL